MPSLPLTFETELAPQLALADVQAMLRLVSETCDPTLEVTVAERRQRLFAGVAKLVDADCYLGGIGCSRPTTCATRRQCSPTMAVGETKSNGCKSGACAKTWSWPAR